MTLLLILGGTSLMLVLRYFLLLTENRWNIIRLALGLGGAALLFHHGDPWQQVVANVVGIWGGIVLLQVLYDLLLAGGDLCRLIVQRNTQTRRR